jgi:hypothetical protein
VASVSFEVALDQKQTNKQTNKLFINFIMKVCSKKIIIKVLYWSWRLVVKNIDKESFVSLFIGFIGLDILVLIKGRLQYTSLGFNWYHNL